MIKIISVSGPLVKGQVQAGGIKPKLLETVFVGNKKLLGEVIAIKDDIFSIQVYEETTGITVGEEVALTGNLLSVDLGPGLIGTIFDGIQRPLKEIDLKAPVFIPAGLHIPSLDQGKVWNYSAKAFVGQEVSYGSILGTVPESGLIEHSVLMPPAASLYLETGKKLFPPFKVVSNPDGNYTLQDKSIILEDSQGTHFNLGMSHKWPVKEARPFKSKMDSTKLFRTGQRIIDSFFPILLGSSVSTPGPFGAGKTVTQQQLAKWSDAQVVVYVGCGERGNEMAEMVNLFPTLIDPKSGKPLMDRTVMIANTSNMPIAAREASVYTGITIAEYYRDMGYNVVIMADSTSRWAESMREISARLGELPAEEGYPAYLSSRIAAYYGRSGRCELLSGGEGSVTVIGTVSPAGGDFSDPVVQVTLKNNQVFLGLDADLAAKRHYPSINWNISYSLNEDKIKQHPSQYWTTGSEFVDNVKKAKEILEKETSLLNLVKLVGLDGLSYQDRVNMEIGRSLREDFLQQDSFDEVDTYCSEEKMQLLLKMIIDLYEKSLEALSQSSEPELLVKEIYSNQIKSMLGKAKFLPEISELKETILNINNYLESL
jgi:V/A-type H+/Na+-transporting ATPase subunit A